MSIDIQKQIKENSQDVHTFFNDLTKWTDDMGKKERRREMVRTEQGTSGKPVASSLTPVRGAGLATTKTRSGNSSTAVTQEEGEVPIERDKQSMPQYYQNWDHFDADEEVEKLDGEEFAAQRTEKLERDAQRDREADERALQYGVDGDRSRTSKAKPRVKVRIRGGNRRASPVDLAAPKKEQANQYFAEGRFRDAVATYTAGLDHLEKYEPPESKGADTDQSTLQGDTAESELPLGKPGDCIGEDADAIALKVSLLANRAAAALKLEAWREAAEDCTECLQFNPAHHKAVLRRGFALAKLKRWSPAARDLEKATKNDPNDKKAAAEFQMALRMLADQAKAVRAHAKCQICDPTRAPTMPLRRLKVVARRASDGYSPDAWAPPATTSTSSIVNTQAAAAEAAVANEVAAAPAAPQKKPYVPRSVRMRGSPHPSSASGGTAGTSAAGGGTNSIAGAVGPSPGGPTMNFYAFEAQWTRLRDRPVERVQLLRKVGTAALPALFRESLDAELVAQIAEALRVDMRECKAEDRSEIAAFAMAAFASLVRTPRFDLSLRGLSSQERLGCEEVLLKLRELAVARAAPASELAALSEIDSAFEPPAALAVDEMD